MTSRALTVVVVIGLSGCGRLGFDASSSDPDARATDPDARATDPNAPLARWRLNEARAGRAIRELLDDTPDPVDLGLSYAGPSPVWREGNGGRYLDFSYTIGDMVDTGGAQAVASGTKLDQLDGSQGVTVETKHAWGACVNRDPRIVEIANGELATAGGWLSVRENNNTEVFAIHLRLLGHLLPPP